RRPAHRTAGAGPRQAEGRAADQGHARLPRLSRGAAERPSLPLLWLPSRSPRFHRERVKGKGQYLDPIERQNVLPPQSYVQRDGGDDDRAFDDRLPGWPDAHDAQPVVEYADDEGAEQHADDRAAAAGEADAANGDGGDG